MKIIKNPDILFANEVMAAVKANNGYCPCQLIKTPDTKCMCREFREQEEPGLCHCGLYEKVPS